MTDERRKLDAQRWAQNEERLHRMEEMLGTLYQRMDGFETSLSANNDLTQRIAEDTEGLRGVMNDAAAGLRLACRIAQWWRFTVRYIVLPIGGLVLTPFLIWYWFTHDYTFPIWVERLVGLFK